MTRTAPIYTVRWSSQISKNQRLGPPTPAPNAVSAAVALLRDGHHHNFYVVLANSNLNRLIAIIAAAVTIIASILH